MEPVSGSSESDPKTINRARFELELEFVQALANPYYLHSLAQQNILDQPAFINFLQYLLYFKEKDYARFIQFVSIHWFRLVLFYLAIHTLCITLSFCNTRSSERI